MRLCGLVSSFFSRIDGLADSFVRSLARSFVHSFIYPSIHPPILPLFLLGSCPPRRHHHRPHRVCRRRLRRRLRPFHRRHRSHRSLGRAFPAERRHSAQLFGIHGGRAPGGKDVCEPGLRGEFDRNGRYDDGGRKRKKERGGGEDGVLYVSWACYHCAIHRMRRL